MLQRYIKQYDDVELSALGMGTFLNASSGVPFGYEFQNLELLLNAVSCGCCISSQNFESFFLECSILGYEFLLRTLSRSFLNVLSMFYFLEF